MIFTLSHTDKQKITFPHIMKIQTRKVESVTIGGENLELIMDRISGFFLLIAKEKDFSRLRLTSF